MALAAIFSGSANAQNHIIKSNNIASLQVVAGNNWLSMPVIKLNGTDPINVSFDDLTHQYRRYASGRSLHSGQQASGHAERSDPR